MSTQTTTRPWLIVMRREVLSKITDKTFLIGTLVTVALIAGYMGFMAWSSTQTDEWKVAATPEAVAMAEATQTWVEDMDDDSALSVVEADDAEDARGMVSDGKADAWLTEGEEGWVLTFDDSEDTGLERIVAQVVSAQVIDANAADLGTTIAELQAGSEVSTELMRGDSERAGVVMIVGFAFAFLFYLASIMFGMQLANSVVEEKQSRIVEIIAAAIPLRHLLAGKVLGNTVLAIGQMLVYVGVGLIGLSFTEYSSYLPQLGGPVLWFLAFFVAGFIALACMWAVAGALASRTEDLQATSTPITMGLVVIFIGALTVQGTPQVVLSFVPPVSAILMPQRILAGDAAWWEPLVALGLLAAFALLLVALGERLYRRALMQTGGKVSLRQAWSAAE